jgi:hypothetical protein
MAMSDSPPIAAGLPHCRFARREHNSQWSAVYLHRGCMSTLNLFMRRSATEAGPGKRPPLPRGEPTFPFKSKNAKTAKQKATIVESIKKGRVEIDQMRGDFKKAGHPNSQFNPMLQALRTGKFLQATDHGRYKLTASGLNGAA